jgi:hypothetical protein
MLKGILLVDPSLGSKNKLAKNEETNGLAYFGADFEDEKVLQH